MDYWKMGQVELLRGFSAADSGLSSAEAKGRLEEHGPNAISEADKKTPLRIFISQFQNPLVYILIGATAIAFFLGEGMDALIILAIVVMNAVLGFVQEYRSEKALEELRRYVSMTARALRDGHVLEVDVRELVPGDVILISIGDIVPADARLLEAHGLESDESVLTGESVPVPKNAEPLDLEKAEPYQMANSVFMGATIKSGSGKALVVATGRDTFLGKSAKSLRNAEEATDFEKSIRSFGGMLLRVILVMTFFVFVINSALGHGLLESFLFALAIAVGITPELLPIVITIGLSHGALALVKKHVAVKKLQAIEDLGNMDILCADKTGTLTENVVTLIRYLDCEGKDDERVLDYSLLCNSAVVQHGKVKGGSIDSAIWTYAISKSVAERTKGYRRIALVAFDYERKRMSVAVESGRERLLICKGAPEEMLPICTHYRSGGKSLPIGKKKASLKRMAEGFGADGYRVIVVASKDIGKKEEYSPADESDLTFLGFLILMDPPRKDTFPALERFRKLGVKMYVLTGDGPLVTGEVCRQVGVENLSGKVILGSDIAGLEEADLRKIVEKNNIYARLTPEDKLSIVKALRANGHIVGFIGDGVNDAPSLKAADVGISVSSGADIAKEASDVVLLRKHLNVVANGISEGRRTFGNITKYIHGTISANFGNMFTLTISSLFLPFIPLLPSQVLLNNFISDVPMLTVSTDNVDRDDLRKPQRWDIGRINRFMVYFGLISSVFDLITMAFVYFVLSAEAGLFRTVWFIESVLTEIFVVFSIRTFRPFWKSAPSALLLISSFGAAALVFLLVFSPLAPFFQFMPINFGTAVVIIAIVTVYVLVVELAKHRFFAGEAARDRKEDVNAR
ncbi:MAG: magnesium-translocating P-type ATPase [Candidatus Micrarchaeota archaeon]